jgi:hypothetical protein
VDTTSIPGPLLATAIERARVRDHRGRVRRPLAGALLLAACVAHGLASSARAQLRPPLPNAGPPLILQLEGILQPTKDAARASGFDVASIGFLGQGRERDRWLGVTKARTIGGDHPLDGRDVLAIVAPFQPNLLVTGPPEVVARLSDAPSGSRVSLEGLVDRGARTYYLRAADVAGRDPPE